VKIRQLIKISDLNDEDLSFLLKKSVDRRRELERGSQLKERRAPVALLFFENSTRTRVSFERAAQIVGCPLVLIEAKGSSVMKGETLEDTVLNLRALRFSNFVVRTHETGGLEIFRNWKGVGVINAGDGTGEHPTQALLDAATLLESRAGGDLTKLRGLKLGIYGDLRHSRVARSWNALAPRLGIELRFMSPEAWKPLDWGHLGSWSSSCETEDLDVIMALRVQRERQDEEGLARVANDFVEHFGLKPADLSPEQSLMHPGPVNWGVELDPAWRGDPRNLILRQVEMGLAVRSVLLEHLENG
jgi:aspartate carbamoyltransferase catalytic subunit